MKRWKKIFWGVLPGLLLFVKMPGTVQASRLSENDWEQETNEDEEYYINDILEELDFREIDEFLKELEPGRQTDFKEIVRAFLSGDIYIGLEMLKVTVSERIFGELRSGRRAVIHLMVIALIAATLTGFSDIFQSRQISEVSYYMVYMLLLTILMKAFGAASLILEQTLERIVDFMKILMPSFVMAMGFATGGITGAAFYEWVLLLVTVVQWLLKRIIMPAVHIYVLLMMVDQMVKEDHLSKMAELFRTASEWMTKTLMAAVMGFNLVQGLITPALDGLKKDVLTKTAGMIPGVGNVFSSVSDLVLGSAILIKNSIGAAALLILAVICLVPAVKLLVLSAGYKLAAAVVQPVSDSRIVECINCVGEGMLLLLKIMMTSGVLFWLTLAVMCAATGGR